MRLEQAGKPFKVILTACMRKLLIILNALAKTTPVLVTSIPSPQPLENQHSRSAVQILRDTMRWVEK